MFEDTITKTTTKKYKRAVDFFNLIQNENLLDKIDIHGKTNECLEMTIGEQTVYINKQIEGGFLEIFLKIDNFNHLRTKKITKREFDKLYKVNKVWIYDKDENIEYITFKRNYSKENTQFIHNNLWFKDFN